jgi:hypothetical protein
VIIDKCSNYKLLDNGMLSIAAVLGQDIPESFYYKTGAC